jgi:hypothetical protein
MGCPALDDGSVEQTLGARHRQRCGDAHGARRLPEDGDFAGVPTQGCYVFLRPFERGDLVEKARVSDAIAQVEEAFGAYHPELMVTRSESLASGVIRSRFRVIHP